MPQTINGIGTWYYGRKNVHTHRGVCEHCHQAVELTSYETRLWFVVFFIPVIPLGRKQILDKCPKCTWHRAVPVAEWERMQQEGIQEAGDQTAKDPTDPEAAMELHGTLVAFQQHEKAEAFAEIMARKFADNADVQFHLGSWHENEGRDAEADACFEKALELEPENVPARRAVGIGCIQRGDLAKAREFLAPVLEPGEHQEPGVMVLLADAHQAKGEHEQALALYQGALEAAPQFGRDKKLRKRVAASERALGATTSSLPKLPVSRRLLVLAGLTVVVLGGLLAANFYLSSHQTLHIVNRLGADARVAIDGREPVTVRAGGRATVALAEGRHQAVVRREGVPDETVDLDVRNGLLQRLGRDSVFVLNVAGAADLLWEENVYTTVPDPDATRPYRVHFGKKFLTFRKIDYAFERFPKELRTESSRVTKRRVSVIEAEPAAVLVGFPEGTPPDELLRFAEHHLTLTPFDDDLLQGYYLVAASHEQLDRLREFLATGLDRRPVAIPWHRIYQEACKQTGKHGALPARYEAMLATEPGSSALLYLRGRLEANGRKALPFYDKAIAADARNPFAWYAKGYRLMARDEFAAAKTACTEACRLRPGDDNMAETLFELRFALGELQALEVELREKLAKEPTHLGHHERLQRVLLASGRTTEAIEAHKAYVDRVKAKPTAHTPLILDLAERTFKYLTGDIDGYVDSIRAVNDPALRRAMMFSAHCEQGNLEEAEQIAEESPGQRTGHGSLLLCLGWLEKGNAARARQWRQRAAEAFAASRPEEQRIALLLTRGDQLAWDEVDDIVHGRVQRATILVALAAACPSKRQALLDRAEKFNPLGGFPHRYLRRIIAHLRN